MKSVLKIALVILVFASLLPAQSSVKSTVKQLKKTEQYEGISIPGWIIRLGLKFVNDQNEDVRSSGLLRIAKKIKHLNVAITNLDTKIYNTKAIVNNFIKGFKEKDGFEEYISVRSEDQNLKIMVIEDKDVIKNLVILSEDQGEIAMIHLKTSMTLDDLKSVSFRQLKNDSSRIKTDTNKF